MTLFNWEKEKVLVFGKHVMETCPIPVNKNDVSVAKGLSNYDGPVSEKEYQRIIVWLKDERWPVFTAVVSFLVKRGVGAQGAIEYVLKSKNGPWKKNVIKYILTTWSKTDLQVFSRFLPNLATDADLFGPDLVVAELLLEHNLVDSEWLKQWLEHKRKTLSEKVKEVDELLSKFEC